MTVKDVLNQIQAEDVQIHNWHMYAPGNIDADIFLLFHDQQPQLLLTFMDETLYAAPWNFPAAVTTWTSRDNRRIILNALKAALFNGAPFNEPISDRQLSGMRNWIYGLKK